MKGIYFFFMWQLQFSNAFGFSNWLREDILLSEWKETKRASVKLHE